MINKGMMSSNTDQWATPQWFFDEVAKEFDFMLDVCADSTNHKCLNYFDKEKNGLEQNWAEHIEFGSAGWMNPPYGREIGKWCERAATCGRTIVGLLPARTDTKYFHKWIYHRAEIRFIKGRLKFGDAKNSAPFPSMLVIWRQK